MQEVPKVPPSVEGLLMLVATFGLAAIRPHYNDDTRDLMRVVLNSTSAAEANLALDLLLDAVPEKALVTVCNLREVLASLPSTPFAMTVDEETLMKTAGLGKDRAVMRRTLDDGTEIGVTTAGNLVLDIIISTERGRFYWSPVPIMDDFVTPGLIDDIVESECLLDAIIDLAQAMGLAFNPKFYLSLGDFRTEYAHAAIEGLSDLFKEGASAEYLF